MKKLYKLRFTLKQVVSMIHFQGDEENSTIRATDLKPKLDRFIYHFYAYNNNIQWVNKFEISDEIIKISKVLTHMDNNLKKEILIDYKEMKNFALNYKVKVNTGKECSGKESDLISNRDEKSIEYVGAAKYVMTEKKGKDGKFGRGEPVDVHKIGRKYEEVFIDIICSNKILANLIIEAMPYFIISTGFGYASGKGYGSFMVTNVQEVFTNDFASQCKECNKKLNDIEELLFMYKKIMNYNTEIDSDKNESGDKNKDAILIYELVDVNENVFCKNELECLKIIDQYNHFIKSGTNAYAKNRNNEMKQVYYTNSPLMKGYFGNIEYTNDKEYTNEKKAMKKELIENKFILKSGKRKVDMSKFNIENVLYTRGLFGLAQEYSFLIWDKSKNKYTLRPFNVKGNVKQNNNDISVNRFPNPVSFRILYQNEKYKIFMIVNQAQLIAFQKLEPTFQFSFKKKKEEFIRITATLPNDKLFNIKTFIDNYLIENKGNTVFKYKKNNFKYCDGIKLIEFNNKEKSEV